MISKPFWQRPEGITGGIVLATLLVGGGFLLNSILPALIALAQNGLYLSGMLAVTGAIVFMALDPKARNLVWYLYKSAMRWITGLFVQIDPIGILKSYIGDLENNLRNLSKQVGALRGQMRQLKGIMDGNNTEIQKNMAVAERAKNQSDEKNLTIATRKAGRLQEANAKYDVFHKKMELLYRVLSKMYEDSEIMLEDTRDQVILKEQEYRAIKASHNAIRSAQSILTGNPDQRVLFDQALEAMAEEVSQKVGDMERFMDTSRNLLDSIDLQNGVFQEEGLLLLEKWEKHSPLGSAPPRQPQGKPLDLNTPSKETLKSGEEYHKFFD
ncbi:MAG: PspA/IM30 family protein [Saprospiraceae bacterium]